MMVKRLDCEMKRYESDRIQLNGQKNTLNLTFSFSRFFVSILCIYLFSILVPKFKIVSTTIAKSRFSL